MAMGGEELIELMKEYARTSMEVHYWERLSEYARDNPGMNLTRSYERLGEGARANARMIYERLQEVMPIDNAADALDILDAEVAEIAEEQADEAIRSGAARGLQSAQNALETRAVYASSPVRELQSRIEEAFNARIPDDDGPKGPKGKLLKFGKRVLSALPIVGTGMALLEAGGSIANFRAMQAFASELQDRGVATDADIEELQRLANEYLMAASGEFAAGLSPIPGVAEGGEIALNLIKERLREAYNTLREKLENMEPIEDVEQSSFDKVAEELSEEMGEEFSADDIEELYGDDDSDLDELRERVDAYRERFREHNALILQYRNTLDDLDTMIDGLDNVEYSRGRAWSYNDVPEAPDEGYTPTRVAARTAGEGNSGHGVA